MPTNATRIWDLPTRFFHWALVLSLTGSVVTAKLGGNAMVWHFRLGYVAAVLLLFRLVWGLVGGRWSRFSSFVVTPRAVFGYLRGRPAPLDDVGHSPSGALAVLAMLAVLLVQVATGLVADDEIASVGPLNRFVSSAWAGRATGWHKGWGQWLLLGLVGLHVAAIAYYAFVRRKRLVGSMVHGDKALPGGTPPSLDTASTRIGALLIVLLLAGLWAWADTLLP